jgi:hypothetical protein
MCSASNQIGSPVTAARRRPSFIMPWLLSLVLMALLLGLCPAQADELDDQYLQIYSLIQQADDLNANGKRDPAKGKYQEAFTALRTFKKSYPDWNAKLVSYRLNYVAQKLTALSEKPPAVVGSGTNNAPEAKPEMKASTPTSPQPVKLLQAGAEPRKVLRLHPNPGDKQTLRLTMKMAVETKMGEAQTPAMNLPAMTIAMDITVKDVSNEGDITYEVAMGETSVAEEPGASPQIVKAMKSALAGVKGMSVTGTMSNHGFGKGTEFKAPPGADPQARLVMDQMKDSFAQVAAPLPEEAVGPGAKWEVKMPIKSRGMTVDQTATYELVSIEGEHLTTKSTIIQRAVNQKIDNPIMSGMKVDLTKMTGKATSEFGLDLGKPMPSAGTMDSHSDIAMGLNMGGQNQSITMKMDLNLRLEAK